MSYKHEVRVEMLHNRIEAPVLVVISPIWVMVMLAWLGWNATWGPAIALTFLIALPVSALLLACGLEGHIKWRADLPFVAVASVGFGILPALIGIVDLSPQGIRAMAVERSLDRSELQPTFLIGADFAADLSSEVLTRMSPLGDRRASILLARLGRWPEALCAWQIAAARDPQPTDELVVFAMNRIESGGVCQYDLLRICVTCDSQGYSRQAVALWREYYPQVIPSSWHKPSVVEGR